MDKFRKQNSEKFMIEASILNVQETGEEVSLAGSSVSATDVDGTDVSDTVLDDATLSLGTDPKSASGVTNNTLRIRVQEGAEASSPYHITFIIATDQGNIWEKDVSMIVTEI